jgi:hypothetical protein
LTGVDFSDRGKAIAWLEKQNAEVRCAIASRAALRVCANIHEISDAELPPVAISVLRCILTSSVRSLGRTDDMAWLETAARSAALSAALSATLSAALFAANSARFAADSAAGSAARSAALFAANSAHFAARFATRFAANSAANEDSRNLNITAYTTAVWPDGATPPSIAQNHADFLAFMNSDRATWGFWHDWYLAMWEGRFTDWDLAIGVAKIPDNVWKEGAEAVAAEIDKIRTKLLGAALPQAEIVEFNPQTLRFSARPITVEKPDLIGATLQQVEDSLEDVLASPSNGLSSTSREVRVIERTIRKYGNNPQQIEMGFVSAHAGLTRQIVVADLPASEENLALQAALEEGAIAIRATHPDVAENRTILTKRKFAEMSQEQKDVLADALPVLRAISDEALADDWEHDIPALINTSMGPLPSGAPALPGADEATRIFSRVAKISILLQTSEVIHAIDNSAPYKAAGIAVTVGGLVALGWTLLTLI